VVTIKGVNECVLPAPKHYVIKMYGGVGSSIPGLSMWNLCRTKWHWDRLFIEFFGFPPVSILPPILHLHSFICHRCYVISVIDSVIKQTLLSLAQLCLWFISCRCRVPHTIERRSVRWLVCLLGQVHGTVASSHRLTSWELQKHNDFSPFYCKQDNFNVLKIL